jgi:hypothetical protein
MSTKLVKSHTLQLQVSYVNQDNDAAMSCQIPSFKKLAKSDQSLNVPNALFLPGRCEVKFQNHTTSRIHNNKACTSSSDEKEMTIHLLQ